MVAILVLLTIVGFLLADWIVQMVQARRVRAGLAEAGFQTGLAVEPAGEVPTAAEGIEESDPYPPPRGLFFHRGHCWAQIEPMGMWRVGMDGLISQLVGRIDEIHLPVAGTQVREGDTLATIKQGSNTLSLRSPVEGEVFMVNETLRPRTLKLRPYSDGWLCVVQPKALAADTRRLVVGDEVVGWHRKEFQRIADFFTGLPKLGGRMVYDSRTGVPLLVAVMERAGESDWLQFQKLFLEDRS